jgi:hypothetical protein
MLFVAVAVIAGTVVFTACKKDKDEDPAGVRVAKAMCDCFKKTTEEAQETCAEGVYLANKDILTEDGDFKDEKVAAEAFAWILTNCSEVMEWEYDEDDE